MLKTMTEKMEYAAEKMKESGRSGFSLPYDTADLSFIYESSLIRKGFYDFWGDYERDLLGKMPDGSIRFPETWYLEEKLMALDNGLRKGDPLNPVRRLHPDMDMWKFYQSICLQHPDMNILEYLETYTFLHDMEIFHIWGKTAKSIWREIQNARVSSNSQEESMIKPEEL